MHPETLVYAWLDKPFPIIISIASSFLSLMLKYSTVLLLRWTRAGDSKKYWGWEEMYKSKLFQTITIVIIVDMITIIDQAM